IVAIDGADRGRRHVWRIGVVQDDVIDIDLVDAGQPFGSEDQVCIGEGGAGEGDAADRITDVVDRGDSVDGDVKSLGGEVAGHFHGVVSAAGRAVDEVGERRAVVNDVPEGLEPKQQLLAGAVASGVAAQVNVRAAGGVRVGG